MVAVSSQQVAAVSRKLIQHPIKRVNVVSPEQTAPPCHTCDTRWKRTDHKTRTADSRSRSNGHMQCNISLENILEGVVLGRRSKINSCYPHLSDARGPKLLANTSSSSPVIWMNTHYIIIIISLMSKCYMCAKYCPVFKSLSSSSLKSSSSYLHGSTLA